MAGARLGSFRLGLTVLSDAPAIPLLQQASFHLGHRMQSTGIATPVFEQKNRMPARQIRVGPGWQRLEQAETAKRQSRVPKSTAMPVHRDRRTKAFGIVRFRTASHPPGWKQTHGAAPMGHLSTRNARDPPARLISPSNSLKPVPPPPGRGLLGKSGQFRNTACTGFEV